VSLGGHSILESVSACVPKEGCTAIVGPNGAGKTTLLLALLGEVPYSGNIKIPRADKRQPLRVGYVPQRLQFDPGLPLTVLEFMVMGWQRRPLWFGVRRKYRERALELLKAVKVDGLARQKIGSLSGGEFQRVLLALALGQRPELLVLDEPASGVDFQGEHVFCELLDNLRREHGFTQLMVSHDLSTVTYHATHVICLNRKVAAEGPPREVLTSQNLTAIFGLHMGLVNTGVIPLSGGARSATCCDKEQR
jgi:zinc transport system ATP-binding protein